MNLQLQLKEYSLATRRMNSDLRRVSSCCIISGGLSIGHLWCFWSIMVAVFAPYLGTLKFQVRFFLAFVYYNQHNSFMQCSKEFLCCPESYYLALQLSPYKAFETQDQYSKQKGPDDIISPACILGTWH